MAIDLTLTEFLIARITERRRTALRNEAGSRLMTECDALRRIVELHSAGPGQHPDFCGHDLWKLPCPTLRHLGSIYFAHPGYQSEWAP
jgi:hypothetical protein